jgi:hypothetical protein
MTSLHHMAGPGGIRSTRGFACVTAASAVALPATATGPHASQLPDQGRV